MKTTKYLQNFFEQNDFNVDLFEQDKEQCAEIEKWTNGGVDMIITLMPFNEEEFIKYVDDFNIDEEIDLHRQDKRYRNDFSIRRSVKDFTDFHKELKRIVKKLNKTIK